MNPVPEFSSPHWQPQRKEEEIVENFPPKKEEEESKESSVEYMVVQPWNPQYYPVSQQILYPSQAEYHSIEKDVSKEPSSNTFSVPIFK